ncbi:hypothetical protein [Pseudogemmobacter sp. W21_MBD1_M6]|uniref:hypothetical protein n=1 Tax=Pseudogemmobacter sp. W21_MBD1_M6 TaxID=3240271 RepID=UPI003F96C936
MTSETKDSEYVIEFNILFQMVRKECKDKPEDLKQLCERDHEIDELCRKLSDSAEFLDLESKSKGLAYVAPVDPNHIRNWNDFRLRYTKFLPKLFETSPPTDPYGQLWNSSDQEASDVVTWIETNLRGSDTNLDELQEALKLDVRGVARRTAMFDTFLIPRKISNHYNNGNSSEPSMLNLLEQAQTAFIHGAPYAAIALMRAVVEATLRDHYVAKGETLDVMIESARKQENTPNNHMLRKRPLPKVVNPNELHYFRITANNILHSNTAKDEQSTLQNRWWMDQKQTEKQLVKFFGMIRKLIES